MISTGWPIMAGLGGTTVGLALGAYLGIKIAVVHVVTRARDSGVTTDEIRAFMVRLRAVD